jgi:hypothetical protein
LVNETNSPATGKPNSDAIQRQQLKCLQQLDADVYTVREISDDISVQMVK